MQKVVSISNYENDENLDNISAEPSYNSQNLNFDKYKMKREKKSIEKTFDKTKKLIIKLYNRPSGRDNQNLTSFRKGTLNDNSLKVLIPLKR